MSCRVFALSFWTLDLGECGFELVTEHAVELNRAGVADLEFLGQESQDVVVYLFVLAKIAHCRISRLLAAFSRCRPYGLNRKAGSIIE